MVTNEARSLWRASFARLSGKDGITAHGLALGFVQHFLQLNFRLHAHNSLLDFATLE